MPKPYYEDTRSGITIYHGDAEDILPTLTADVMVTDPPYGIGFASQPTLWQRRAGQAPESWDEDTFNDLDLLLRSARHHCIWGGNYYALPPSRGWLVWMKPDAPPSMGSVELAWTNVDRTTRHIIHSISATNAERVGHPTQKPLAVMRWSIGFMPDGLIVDPFMGSGTTLRAAMDLGRSAIGIERDERYCEIAARRMSQQVLHLAS